MASYPTITEVRDWIGIPIEDVTDEQLQQILDAEIELQSMYCPFIPNSIPDGEIPNAMAQALLRRCARTVAARGVPLGTLPGGDSGMGANSPISGAGLLPRYDAEIERLEDPFRLAGIA